MIACCDDTVIVITRFTLSFALKPFYCDVTLITLSMSSILVFITVVGTIACSVVFFVARNASLMFRTRDWVCVVTITLELGLIARTVEFVGRVWTRHKSIASPCKQSNNTIHEVFDFANLLVTIRQSSNVIA